MKDKILNINLETQTAPQVKENSTNEWVNYGTEDNLNLYPNFLIDLFIIVVPTRLLLQVLRI